MSKEFVFSSDDLEAFSKAYEFARKWCIVDENPGSNRNFLQKLGSTPITSSWRRLKLRLTGSSLLKTYGARLLSFVGAD